MAIRDWAVTLGNWLVLYPVVDVGLAILWTGETVRAWREWTGVPEQHRETAQGIEERRLGATVILGEIQYLVVGASVILAGVGAFAALAINQHANNLVKHSIVYAAAWAVCALLGGVYATSLLPHHTLKHNFVLIKELAIWIALALFMLVAAAARLLLAVWLLLMG